MATISITNHVCKGVRNTVNNAMMTWWQTSFNMPVTQLYGTTWVEGGPFQYYGESTSFDLTGFQPGWEICACFTIVHIVGEYPGGPINVHQRWKKPNGTVIFTNEFLNVDIAPLGSGQWSEFSIASNQGFAEWEVDSSGTYTCEVWVDGLLHASNNVNITFSNVPAISTATPGYIWVDADNLHWVSANSHKHTIYGNSVSFVGSQYNGAIWVEGNDICWVGAGTKYRSKYNFRQFASTWSNGAPGPISGQSPGYFWMDNQFGMEHVGYIAGDGYKWLFPSGANPYANPPASSTPY